MRQTNLSGTLISNLFKYIKNNSDINKYEQRRLNVVQNTIHKNLNIITFQRVPLNLQYSSSTIQI